MTKGLFALIFVLLIVVIIFLMFQINDNANKCKESKVSQQERVTRAAKLIVQSSTQNHPLMSHEHALEAKVIIDDVISQNGGVISTEKALKLDKGRIENLRTQIYQQYQDVQTFIMEKIIEKQPDLDLDINEEAGLRKKKKKRKKVEKSNH
jgi:hypothetical protein